MAKKKIKISALAASPSNDDWETRSDFNTLCDAKKIEADPKRMGKVREYAQAQMLNAASIATDDEC